MSTSLTSLNSNYFPSPQSGFTTTTAGSTASGAATVSLNSVAGFTNGQIAVFVIEPTSTTAKQTFTGVIDTAGVQVTSVVWTAGTNQTHALGSTVVDYAAATHIAMITKGILAAGITQAGGMGAISPTSVTSPGTVTAANFVQTGGASANGWTVGLTAPNTVTALGNRSYSLVANSVDLTSQVSTGMRLKLTRTVPAPTQCTSLNGTTQYYNKASPSAMTFTDDFTASAWIKLSSYPGTRGAIAARFNNTSGWWFVVLSDGRLELTGFNAASANFSRVQSYQAVPLNRWVHVSAQLDMSTFTATTTTSYTMFDGIDVPASVSRGGTNPISLVIAAVDLQIGASNSTDFFPGKLAQVAIYNAKVTQATILASMNQTLSGSETSLISAYSFNNTINDLSANANNLTANGAAVATNADSPFGGQADGTISSTLDYGIITRAVFSTNTTLTVQVPEGCTVPTSGGVSAVSYSTQKAPYGMPIQSGKWRVTFLWKAQTNVASNATFAAFTGMSFVAPTGEWTMGYDIGLFNAVLVDVYWCLSSTSQTGLTNATSDSTLQSRIISPAASTVTSQSYVFYPFSHASATTYAMYTLGATTSAGLTGSTTKTELFAELALL